ncbi:MAG: helix-turn-helix domain-containing protein [Acidimicrobiales bacterium]
MDITAPLPPLPPLWTVSQLAEYLGVPHSFVYRLTHEHRIRFLRVGKTVRFRPEDVMAWLESATVEPSEPKRRGRPRRHERAA